MLYSKVLSIYLGTRTYGQANRDPFDKEGCRGGSETGVCVVTATIPVSEIIQTNRILVADWEGYLRSILLGLRTRTQLPKYLFGC